MEGNAGKGLEKMTRYDQELSFWAEQSELWNKLNGRTVMISGATGMIGKCLVDLLMLRNHKTNMGERIRIVAMSRNEASARECFQACWNSEWFRYISCDVNQPIPECGEVDYIIHAASNTHPKQYSQDSIGTIATNIFGTKNLLDYGIAHGIRQFCFVSSVEIYGENRGDTEKFDEGYLGYLDCNTLRAGYPESKRLGEALCNAYRETYGMDFVIPRLSRVYGPTLLLSDTKAISQFIKKAARGEDIVLKSKGTQKYSYVFVTDAVAGILWTMCFGKVGEAYNVANETSDITLRELAKEMAGLSGTKVIFELPQESEKKGYSAATKAMLDVVKLKKIGWEARVSIKEGILCTVEAVRGHLGKH